MLNETFSVIFKHRDALVVINIFHDYHNVVGHLSILSTQTFINITSLGWNWGGSVVMFPEWFNGFGTSMYFGIVPYVSNIQSSSIRKVI